VPPFKDASSAGIRIVVDEPRPRRPLVLVALDRPVVNLTARLESTRAKFELRLRADAQKSPRKPPRSAGS
jgi:hypothetical protein